MTETVADLRRKLVGATDLQSVVRTMKAVAASSIVQYENSVLALADYYRTIEFGLSVCFRQLGKDGLLPETSPQSESKPVGAVVLGTDQGLVGRFNDAVAEQTIKTLKRLPGESEIWAVGERVESHLVDAGLQVRAVFPVPTSVNAITPLIGRILMESEKRHGNSPAWELYLFHNRPISSAIYEPVGERLLPLDASWRRNLLEQRWPNQNLPEVIGRGTSTLRALIREFLFVSLFRACAESLASENASRLAAMQRADKNIAELLDNLNGNYHRLRQGSIDAELFDLISGFEALAEN